MSGRHRSYVHIGRGRLRVPVALGVVSAVIVVAAVTVRIVAASAAGCTGGVALRVAATPEIAPVLAGIGADWMDTRPEVGGQCVNLRVVSVAAPSVASSLTVLAGGAIDVAAAPEPTPRPDEVPMVWVPDSSAWLTRVQAVDRSAFEPDAVSIASSPVVIAMTGATGEKVGWPGQRLPVATMSRMLATGALKLGVADPRRETASLAATVMLDSDPESTEGLPALVKALRGVTRASSTGELLRLFGPNVNAGPVSEQAVLSFNATQPAQPLVAVQLDPASPLLDYPFAVRAGLARESAQAAEAFRAAILATNGAEKLARKAFRGPDGTAGAGFPSSSATRSEPYRGEAITEPEAIQRSLGLWSAANSPSRTLALLDITSSMDSRMHTVGRDATRAEVMVAAATAGLNLFTADSRVGLWTFASRHSEVLAIDDLTAQRKAELAARMASARPADTNRSELYATLLAAFNTMQDEYDPTRPNIIVVLTDGGDSNTSALRVEQFNQALQKIADPTKPIRVVLIGIDAAQADATNLHTIATTVGGGYFALTRPEQIQAIFINALLRIGTG